MTTPTVQFATVDRDDTTLLEVNGAIVATITRMLGDEHKWLTGLYEPDAAGHVFVWCESREAATGLAEFHARMCARLVSGGVLAAVALAATLEVGLPVARAQLEDREAQR